MVKRVTPWVPRTLLLALAAALSMASDPAATLANIGVAVTLDPKTPGDTNTGITAHDIFTMLDNKLQGNAGSLIAIFGGCYTSDFTNEAKKPHIAMTSGKVAVLAATTADPTVREGQCTPATQNGNAFLLGIAEGWQNDKTGDYDAPIGTAFAKGVERVHDIENNPKYLRKNADDPNGEGKPFEITTPVPTYFGGGETLTLTGNPKAEKHAIIFIGYPKDYADWIDVHDQFQALVNAGYPPGNIKVFFGTGEGTPESPRLAKGKLVKDDAIEKHATADFKYNPLQGPKGAISYQAATFTNLKEELVHWGAFAKLPENKGKIEFFISFGDHDTPAAHDRCNDTLAMIDMSDTCVATAQASPPEDHGLLPFLPSGVSIGIGFGRGGGGQSRDVGR
jgi:hypothetical protein